MLLLSAVLGYLIGSVSLSILLSKKLYGKDIRQSGSGNAGATNAARVYGWGAGFITLGGDFAKGIVSMWLGLLLAGEPGLAIAGITCLLGHCFPLYYRFRGGKAVSVGLSVALMVDWRLCLLAIIVFSVVAFSTRLVSLASMSAAVALGIAAPIMHAGFWDLLLMEFAAALLVFMHRANIRRLCRGEEPKFIPGSRQKTTVK